MPWPKTFPNPEWKKASDPQWRPVKGRPNIYIHDDVPTQEVEVLLLQCSQCGHEQQTMHSIGPTKAAAAAGIVHLPTSDEARRIHSTCPGCEQQLVAITLEQSKKDKRLLRGSRWTQ